MVVPIDIETPKAWWRSAGAWSSRPDADVRAGDVTVRFPIGEEKQGGKPRRGEGVQDAAQAQRLLGLRVHRGLRRLSVGCVWHTSSRSFRGVSPSACSAHVRHQEEKDDVKLVRKAKGEVGKEKQRVRVMKGRGLKRSEAQSSSTGVESSSTRVESRRSRLPNPGIDLALPWSPHPIGPSIGQTSADPQEPGVGSSDRCTQARGPNPFQAESRIVPGEPAWMRVEADRRKQARGPEEC